MPNSVEQLCRDLQIQCVLMDVGATGEPPALWRELAPFSTYVGVGPAATPTGRSLIKQFARAHAVEKIVTATAVTEVALHLMRNSIYSSLLEAHPQATTEFFDPRLAPNGKAMLPATTVDAIVRDLELPGIDWLHTNINGLDVPVFQSLGEPARSSVLALDSCLDVVDLYQGQQSGVARYPEMLEAGFWLSRSFTDGPIRMSDRALTRLRKLDTAIDEAFVTSYQRRTPGWIFVRFLRTREWLASRHAPKRDYVLLWAFALLDGQFGFCADLLSDYEEHFDSDGPLRTMEQQTVARMKALQPGRSIRTLSRKYLPAQVRRRVRRFLGSA